MNIKGTVEAVSVKGTRYGIRIGEDWYNGFGDCDVKKDDIVDLDFKETEKNGTLFKNIAKINTIRSGAPDEVQPGSPAPAKKQESQAKESTDDDVDEEVDFLFGIYHKFSANADISQRPVSDLALATLTCQAYRFLRFGKFNKK